MNVYVRELSSALARAGVDCDVYTRTWRPGLPDVVDVEPGFRVHHVPAGPDRPVAIDDLVDLVPEFTAGVRRLLLRDGLPDLLHANYWLSGLSGHVLKHELGLPLVSTFHTLARVKAESDADHDGHRARAEAEIIGCSDAILALSADEAVQLERLYEAVPAPGRDRAPGRRPAPLLTGRQGRGPRRAGAGRRSCPAVRRPHPAAEGRRRRRPHALQAGLGVGDPGRGGRAQRPRGRRRAGPPAPACRRLRARRDGSGSTLPGATTS